MNESYLRFLAVGDADRVVEALTRRQFIRPHQTVGAAVAGVVEELGVCPEAAREAVEFLGVDSGISVGRLRRTELIQLARTVYRMWRQNVVESSTPSQPT